MAPLMTEADLKKIIVDGDAKLLVTRAESCGSILAGDGLSKTQIRGVFGTVREVQAAWSEDVDSEARKNMLRRILLMKPRLAYQAKREEKLKPLAEILAHAIDLIAEEDNPGDQRQRFTNFVDMFEAILAYHTAYQGRRGG